MGRRGQGEMERSKVSADVMPALRATVCWHRAEAAGKSANKVVPQDSVFLSLFPIGGAGIFLLERMDVYDKPRKTMATENGSHHILLKHHIAKEYLL